MVVGFKRTQRFKIDPLSDSASRDCGADDNGTLACLVAVFEAADPEGAEQWNQNRQFELGQKEFGHQAISFGDSMRGLP